MEQIEVVAYRRKKVSAAKLRDMRMEGNVPGILYGININELFLAPAILIKKIVHSSNPKLILFNLEGQQYMCVMKDVQFHPVSDMILHVDFLVVSETKPVTMMVPIEIVGVSNSVGVKSGGLLLQKLRKVSVCGLYKHIPSKIEVDVSCLEAGKTLRIEDSIHGLSNDIILKIDSKTPVVEIKAQRK